MACPFRSNTLFARDPRAPRRDFRATPAPGRALPAVLNRPCPASLYILYPSAQPAGSQRLPIAVLVLIAPGLSVSTMRLSISPARDAAQCVAAPAGTLPPRSWLSSLPSPAQRCPSSQIRPSIPRPPHAPSRNVIANGRASGTNQWLGAIPRELVRNLS